MVGLPPLDERGLQKTRVPPWRPGKSPIFRVSVRPGRLQLLRGELHIVCF